MSPTGRCVPCSSRRCPPGSATLRIAGAVLPRYTHAAVGVEQAVAPARAARLRGAAAGAITSAIRGPQSSPRAGVAQLPGVGVGRAPACAGVVAAADGRAAGLLTAAALPWAAGAEVAALPLEGAGEATGADATSRSRTCTSRPAGARTAGSRPAIGAIRTCGSTTACTSRSRTCTSCCGTRIGTSAARTAGATTGVSTMATSRSCTCGWRICGTLTCTSGVRSACGVGGASSGCTLRSRTLGVVSRGTMLTSVRGTLTGGTTKSVVACATSVAWTGEGGGVAGGAGSVGMACGGVLAAAGAAAGDGCGRAATGRGCGAVADPAASPAAVRPAAAAAADSAPGWSPPPSWLARPTNSICTRSPSDPCSAGTEVRITATHSSSRKNSRCSNALATADVQRIQRWSRGAGSQSCHNRRRSACQRGSAGSVPGRPGRGLGSSTAITSRAWNGRGNGLSERSHSAQP